MRGRGSCDTVRWLGIPTAFGVPFTLPRIPARLSNAKGHLHNSRLDLAGVRVARNRVSNSSPQFCALQSCISNYPSALYKWLPGRNLTAFDT
jgi:hypothetical protein